MVEDRSHYSRNIPPNIEIVKSTMSELQVIKTQVLTISSFRGYKRYGRHNAKKHSL